MRKVTVYHNDAARFMPYQDGQPLVAVTCHWLDDAIGGDAQAVADWAFHTFNADLDILETARVSASGEISFLAACVYRLLGHRSLSVGDVIEIRTGEHHPGGGHSVWLACEPFGWRPITAPTNRSGVPGPAAAEVYQRLAALRGTR